MKTPSQKKVLTSILILLLSACSSPRSTAPAAEQTSPVPNPTLAVANAEGLLPAGTSSAQAKGTLLAALSAVGSQNRFSPLRINSAQDELLTSAIAVLEMDQTASRSVQLSELSTYLGELPGLLDTEQPADSSSATSTTSFSNSMVFLGNSSLSTSRLPDLENLKILVFTPYFDNRTQKIPPSFTFNKKSLAPFSDQSNTFSIENIIANHGGKLEINGDHLMVDTMDATDLKVIITKGGGIGFQNTPNSCSRLALNYSELKGRTMIDNKEGSDILISSRHTVVINPTFVTNESPLEVIKGPFKIRNEGHFILKQGKIGSPFQNRNGGRFTYDGTGDAEMDSISSKGKNSFNFRTSPHTLKAKTLTFSKDSTILIDWAGHGQVVDPAATHDLKTALVFNAKVSNFSKEIKGNMQMLDEFHRVKAELHENCRTPQSAGFREGIEKFVKDMNSIIPHCNESGAKQGLALKEFVEHPAFFQTLKTIKASLQTICAAGKLTPALVSSQDSLVFKQAKMAICNSQRIEKGTVTNLFCAQQDCDRTKIRLFDSGNIIAQTTDNEDPTKINIALVSTEDKKNILLVALEELELPDLEEPEVAPLEGIEINNPTPPPSPSPSPTLALAAVISACQENMRPDPGERGAKFIQDSQDEVSTDAHTLFLNIGKLSLTSSSSESTDINFTGVSAQTSPCSMSGGYMSYLTTPDGNTVGIQELGLFSSNKTGMFTFLQHLSYKYHEKAFTHDDLQFNLSSGSLVAQTKVSRPFDIQEVRFAPNVFLGYAHTLFQDNSLKRDQNNFQLHIEEKTTFGGLGLDIASCFKVNSSNVQTTARFKILTEFLPRNLHIAHIEAGVTLPGIRYMLDFGAKVAFTASSTLYMNAALSKTQDQPHLFTVTAGFNVSL